MRYSVTRFTFWLFLACIMLLSTQSAFASLTDIKTQFAPPEVKALVEKDFLNYQNSMDATKDKFGVGGDDSFAKARLGTGIAYYVVEKTVENTENAFTFDGYIFPIQLNSKPVGILIAREINGKWGVFNINNNATFEQDIQSAKNLLRDTDTVKFVYDPAFNLYTLIVQHTSGERSILSMKDHETLNLKKNTLSSISEFQTKLQDMKNKKQSIGKSELLQVGGVGATTSTISDETSTYSFLIVGAVLVLGVLVFLLVKKRKKSE
ncbi:LPXTG cell wall anchor domain-containing protein [Tumebacillus permanentifrigoris]|uniref:LPXTG-motif cell wall-anchored protein n=1 Tax=Tumebacillus permanentifrigoris TaxID=378543 RepID=A0A316D926_9BACL|nr:LPXTG cell wall anchor domain-containing protein [Tumebacillus permanentifrigoris]PWK13127.1 LPXTG-motif cell wall-anchored protein [Tumebacillus permanentifrigoris]